MTTLQKLEKRIRELNIDIATDMGRKSYSFGLADQRDLLEEAAKEIRKFISAPPVLLVSDADFSEADMAEWRRPGFITYGPLSNV